MAGPSPTRSSPVIRPFGDKWHLYEAVISIRGEKYWLWRAVDRDGFVSEVLVQSRRNAKAARRLMRKLLKGQGRAPRVMVTDKLRSSDDAKREIVPGVEHRSPKGLNNRVENSHQPIRRRRQLQCFVSLDDPIANLFHIPRHDISVRHHRELSTVSMSMWADIYRIYLANEQQGTRSTNERQV